jgi:hypothetical protein
MERFDNSGTGAGLGTTAYGSSTTSSNGGDTSTVAPEQTLGTGASAGLGTDRGDRASASGVRGVLDQARDRAQDGWAWVRKNPWPVIGAVAAVGIALAVRRRGDAGERIKHMDSERPVGRARSGSGRTDDVAERMSEGAY